MKYNPTNYLRWIGRVVECQIGNGQAVATIEKVLQQGWAPERGGQVEWRDVPQGDSAAPPVEKERNALRTAQAAAVMPLIGPLMDAWENADREVMADEPELVRWLKAINDAMESAEADA